MPPLLRRATPLTSALLFATWLAAPAAGAQTAPPPNSERPGLAALPSAAPAVPPPIDASLFGMDDVLVSASASLGDLSADGRWAAVTIASLQDRVGIDNHRFADPTYIAPSLAEVLVIDTRTGEQRRVFNDRRQVRALTWSPDGTRLAMLLRDGDRFRPVIWERASGRLRDVRLPAGHGAADNTAIEWSPDGSRLLLGARTDAWWREAGARFRQEVAGPIVVQSSAQPFLSWDEIRRMPLRQTLVLVDAAAGRGRVILGERLLRSFRFAGDGRIHFTEDITGKTDYETIGGSINRVLVAELAPGAEGALTDPRMVIDSTRGFTPIWSGDGTRYAYARDGRIHFGDLSGTAPRVLTGGAADSAAAARATPAPSNGTARGDTARVRFTPVRLSHTGDALIASSRDGLWLIDTASGARERFHESAPEEERDAPRYAVVGWSRDGQHIYLSYSARDQWERGFFRYDRGSRQLHPLVRDDRLYTGFRLSDDGSTIVFATAAANRPYDLHAADRDLTNTRQLTDANPHLAGKRLGESRLIDYLDVDGTKQYGVLYLPPGYTEGTRVPTVFLIYESFFDPTHNATVNFLTARGYAVMQPSVTLETGYPGEGWVKGVTAAANRLIDLGIADAERLGVHGTSYGGYATNLLITQTNRFKAAINISGKVNMISFYTDSPRLGVRNIHAPERSQDRIGATLWEQPQKYIAHSAIMYADRIRTPLLLMTGEQDHNVPARQAMEMYYALRRLGRTVEWVNYANGGHGMPTSTTEEVVDYHARILAWYDRYLKEAEARRTTDS